MNEKHTCEICGAEEKILIFQELEKKEVKACGTCDSIIGYIKKKAKRQTMEEINDFIESKRPVRT